MQEKTITLAALAKHLELHPSSVSRALDPARRHLISPEVVQLVQQEAGKWGYRPNRAAATLRTGKTHCIGVVLPDINNPVFPPILRGIEVGLKQEGYFALVVNAAGSKQATEEQVRNLLAQGVDGLILATAVRKDTLIPMLRKEGVPFVLVNRVDTRSGCTAVVSDDESGMAQAVEHLISLGHNRIAHLAGPQTLSTGEKRLQGFHAAIADAGFGPQHVEFCEAYSIEAGHAACSQLLQHFKAHPTEPMPSALVTCNDLVALGAIDALRDFGLRVPQDVSVTGHNDMPLMDRVEPALTTIRIQHHAMGRSAAELLLQAIANPDRAGTTVMLHPELVLRNSTAHLVCAGQSSITFPLQPEETP